MMISREQARYAAHHLDPSRPARETAMSCDICPELLERVRRHLDGMPDYREERIEAARAMIDGSLPSPHAIADMMIGRIISDSVR